MDVNRPHPRSLSPHVLTVAGWIAFAIAGATFFTLGWNVAANEPIVEIDARVATWLHRHQTQALTSAMLVVTHANSTVAIAAWSVVLGLVLGRLREWYWMLTLALSVAGGLGLNLLLKYAYERARPTFDDPLVTLLDIQLPIGAPRGRVLRRSLAAFLAHVSTTAECRWIVACALCATACASPACPRLPLPESTCSRGCSSTAWRCFACPRHGSCVASESAR